MARWFTPRVNIAPQRVPCQTPQVTNSASPTPAHTPDDITRLLTEMSAGSREAANALASLVYDELHVIAVAAMRREDDGHTWQPTELVHEAFTRLVDRDRATYQNRHHFFGLAAQAMRRLLVDHARRRRAQKRDAGEHVWLEAPLGDAASSTVDVLALNDALERLAVLDARQVQVVELRYFAGFSVEEVAELLDVSPTTVKRDWQVARAFLRQALRDEG